MVSVRPFGEGLILDQLRYAEEVKDFDEVPLGEAEVKEAEMELARQLIDQSSVDDFEAEKYEDEVRAMMLDLIQAKVDGEEISVQPAAEPATQIIDLMSALKASLGDADRKPAERAGKKKAKAAAKKAPRKKKAASA